jgi:hypothetical protein
MAWNKHSRIRLISETQGEGAVREAFEQIKQDLGLPHVSLLHQALAGYPEFFLLHWQAFRPAVAATEFFVLADRLRADAYTRAFSYFEVPDLTAGLDLKTRSELVQFAELLHYENPLLLLIAAAQLQAFDAPLGQGIQPAHPAKRPVYGRVPQCVEQCYAAPFPPPIYDELRNAMEPSLIGCGYRALAQWPGFFTNYWKLLQAAIASPIYEGIRNGIRETAWMLAREMPHPIDLTTARLAEAGLSHDDLASIARLAEVFVEGLSSSVLSTALAHIALEGGEPATGYGARSRRREIGKRTGGIGEPRFPLSVSLSPTGDNGHAGKGLRLTDNGGRETGNARLDWEFQQVPRSFAEGRL